MVSVLLFLLAMAKTKAMAKAMAKEKDIWKVVKQIVKERKKRELEPMLQLLDKLEAVDGDKKDRDVKTFVDTISGIKKLGKQADKTLDTMIRAEETWFVGALMKVFK